MTTRIAPSAALEAAIEELLGDGLGDRERLAEIGRLGARLVRRRAVEEEVARGLGEVELLVLFCDAIYLPTRPSGAKEGVLVALG